MKSYSKQRESFEKWAQAVRKWQKSGKSAKAWCMENDVPYISFIVWRKRLERMNSEEASSLFLRLQSTEVSEPLEIHFQGFTVSVPQQFEPNCLLNCLQVLRSL